MKFICFIFSVSSSILGLPLSEQANGMFESSRANLEAELVRLTRGRMNCPSMIRRFKLKMASHRNKRNNFNSKLVQVLTQCGSHRTHQILRLLTSKTKKDSLIW